MLCKLWSRGDVTAEIASIGDTPKRCAPLNCWPRSRQSEQTLSYTYGRGCEDSSPDRRHLYFLVHDPSCTFGALAYTFKTCVARREPRRVHQRGERPALLPAHHREKSVRWDSTISTRNDVSNAGCQSLMGQLTLNCGGRSKDHCPSAGGGGRLASWRCLTPTDHDASAIEVLAGLEPARRRLTPA